MTTTILDVFRRRGIKVLADGPELVLRAKKSLLTPELLAYAKVHKQQILILLRCLVRRAGPVCPAAWMIAAAKACWTSGGRRDQAAITA